MFRTAGEDIPPPLKNQKTTELLRRTAKKFRPLHDRVVIKRIEAEEKTSAASSSRIPRRKNLRKEKNRKIRATETPPQSVRHFLSGTPSSVPCLRSDACRAKEVPSMVGLGLAIPPQLYIFADEVIE